ncbi:hypothetical protein V4S31_08415 [Enterococcus cecorum]
MIFYESAVKNINHRLWLHTLIEIALILVMSELSYRLIEVPCRRYDYSQLPVRFKQWVKLPYLCLEKNGVCAACNCFCGCVIWYFYCSC